MGEPGLPGPQGPPGPEGPAGTGGSSTVPAPAPGGGGLRLVDNLGEDVGLFFYPNAVAIEAGSDVVFTAIDPQSRSFASLMPTFFYPSPGCLGTPMMYVELTRFGYVVDGTLHYPMGPAAMTPYQSYEDEGGCNSFGGTTTLATRGQFAVGSLVAPFSVVR